MKKKILFVTFWYPSEEEPHRGNFIREQALAVHQNGHHLVVFVIALRYSNSLINFHKQNSKDISGFETYTLTISSFFWKFIYYLNPFINKVAYRYIKKNILNHFEPDIIHSHVINPAAIIGNYISVKIKKPHIITEHWSNIDYFFKNTLFPKMALRAYNDAIFITTVSNYLKDEFSKYIKNKDKIYIIPNIINFTFKFETHLDNDKITFISVSNWEKPKNPQLIFDAINVFAQNCDKPVVYNLIGYGSLLKPLLEDKSEKHFEFNFHGVLSKNEIAVLLNQSHYLLHCSDYETFSIVIAEALSCGVPVLASNKGAIPELIDDSNGIVCENNVNDWVENLKKITTMPYDRKTISENTLAKYSSDVVMKSFNRLYDKL